ncbi:MAG: DUF1488 family protein [Alphaproteobacteria bacterium]|nr:DUF1488 family protein [Alphaproteobacteria bacterium]
MEIPLALQTAYADLVDRCAADAFASAFAEENGGFVPKTVKGRRYWYFQVASQDGSRKQRYVGPETPELLERIERHKTARHDRRDRQTLVSALVRSANLPRPQAEIAQVIAALADAGVFRRRGVLVGTAAYQIYSALLGARLPAAMLQTGDVDIAQFGDVSVAIGEEVPSILDVLRKVDPSFRPVPSLRDPRRATTYRAAKGLRVDFLTPNAGPDTDAPAALPALGTDAQPLRFLDFLIRQPEPAVLLHGAGVHVQVPSPQRYAVHKLIVARRRTEGAIKKDKDLRQAQSLLAALVRKRPHELRSAWREAVKRGKKWKRLVGEGIGLIDHETRDLALRTVGEPRSVVPGLDLAFSAPVGRYLADRDIVEFLGQAGGATVRCAVSREAIEDRFDGDGVDGRGLLRIFRRNRSVFETMARTKYLHWPIEDAASVLVKTADVAELRKRIA